VLAAPRSSAPLDAGYGEQRYPAGWADVEVRATGPPPDVGASAVQWCWRWGVGLVSDVWGRREGLEKITCGPRRQCLGAFWPILN
jgi:hypothetical protein